MSVPSASTIRALNTTNKLPSFYPNDNKVDQFLRKLKFEAVEYSTDQFEYHRASTLPTVTFFGQGGTVSNNATEVSTETNTFVRLGQTCAVDLLDEISSKNDNDPYFSQLEQQVKGTKLSILRKLSDSLINGVGPSEIVGLFEQINTEGNGYFFNLLGAGFTLDNLYYLANVSRSTDDLIGSYQGRYFISNERTLRQVMYLLDSAGRTISFQYDEDLKTEIPVLFGLPWLISDDVFVSVKSNTTIYVAQLEGPTAIKMLYAKDPNAESDHWGITTFDVPLQQTTSQLAKGVFGFYSLKVPEESLAVYSNAKILNAQALP